MSPLSVSTPQPQQAAPGYDVPPVSRALALLRHVAAGNPCRNTSQTARALSINRTTLLRLLATLEREGMIEEIAEGGGYQLGTGLITLAAQALGERSVLQVARPVLRALVEELNLSAHLGVIEGRDIVYLARETPNSHLASTVREGTRLPAHATTIGRILLAQMPPDAVRALYADHALKAYTEKTRTDLDTLLDQLAADRTRGLAWSAANFEPEIGSAAAAVHDHRGQAVGAINVTGHVSLFAVQDAQAQRIETALKRAAQTVSEALGHREESRAQR
ncbi:MAG: IclR family transcriptional regulator [Roseitalea sp.]|jgi:DNA-binding IclR family transcriptional regulator|nr:IclR family transcriptional regulator [Roseitalea sp.]MBO6723322.1 IclR family transcriptional regulator [Roseitalea sp.]MBO6741754.1 IclR family transcriptional regulator [Roseitalea sp.]